MWGPRCIRTDHQATSAPQRPLCPTVANRPVSHPPFAKGDPDPRRRRIPELTETGSESGPSSSLMPLKKTPTPASAARLAAEAAFAATPKHSAPPSLTHITVRRRRLASDLPPAQVGVGPPANTTVTPEPQQPRVFRVDARDARPIAVKEQTRPHRPQTSEAPGPRDVAAPAARRRRTAVNKRPGPVVVVTHAVGPMAPADAGPGLKLDQLRISLASVGPVLDAIARAQSFRFDVGHFDTAWQSLAHRAEALLLSLRPPLRPRRKR
jgi:hypothetical protein